MSLARGRFVVWFVRVRVRTQIVLASVRVYSASSYVFVTTPSRLHTLHVRALNRNFIFVGGANMRIHRHHRYVVIEAMRRVRISVFRAVDRMCIINRVVATRVAVVSRVYAFTYCYVFRMVRTQ